jgi:hypothetical protein
VRRPGRRYEASDGDRGVDRLRGRGQPDPRPPKARSWHPATGALASSTARLGFLFRWYSRSVACEFEHACLAFSGWLPNLVAVGPCRRWHACSNALALVPAQCQRRGWLSAPAATHDSRSRSSRSVHRVGRR